MDRPNLARAETRLVIELERGLTAGDVTYRVTVSLPAREGTLTRDWVLRGTGLTEGQYLDLSHWILATIGHAIVPVDGVAQSLPV